MALTLSDRFYLLNDVGCIGGHFVFSLSPPLVDHLSLTDLHVLHFLSNPLAKFVRII